MIEFRVIQSVQQVDRAGAGGRHADARLAGEFRVRAGHERGHLFVPDLNEIDLLPGALERSHDPVDAIAGITVDAPYTPFAEALDEEVAGCFAHACRESMTRTAPSGRKEIGEDETVTLDDYAAGNREWRGEHWTAIRECVKFTTLAAGVDTRWKIAQKRCIEFASGERSRQESWVDAGDSCRQPAGDHLARELARIAAPERKDRFELRIGKLPLAIGADVLQKQIPKREALDRLGLRTRDRVAHDELIVLVRARTRNQQLPQRQTGGTRLCAQELSP